MLIHWSVRQDSHHWRFLWRLWQFGRGSHPASGHSLRSSPAPRTPCKLSSWENNVKDRHKGSEQNIGFIFQQIYCNPLLIKWTYIADLLRVDLGSDEFWVIRVQSVLVHVVAFACLIESLVSKIESMSSS